MSHDFVYWPMMDEDELTEDVLSGYRKTKKEPHLSVPFLQYTLNILLFLRFRGLPADHVPMGEQSLAVFTIYLLYSAYMICRFRSSPFIR